MKNNKLIVIVVTVVAFILGGFMGSTTARAESAALSVKAILPENQFNKNVSYYYLKVAPGDRQELELEIFNSSKEEATAIVNLTAATTNDSGAIDYNLPDKKLDASLTLPFTDIASTPEEVVVPAGGSVITKISLELPADAFEGMVLGGINVRAKTKEDKEKDSGGGMKIVNEMNYAIGVVLIEDETLVKTNMLYGKTTANQVMGANTTKINLRNDTPSVIEDLAIEAQIYRDGNDEILYESKASDYRMAPNSNFDFRVPIGKDRYRAGKYRVKVVATSDPKNPEKDGEKQVWTFDETFTITPEEAKKLNDSATDIDPDYTQYFIIGGIVVVALAGLTGLIIWLVKRKKKAKETEAAESKKRKSSKSGRSSKSSSKGNKSSKGSSNSKRKRSSK